MQIADFSQFLTAARAQDEAQQLLFVFVVTELPQVHSPDQKQRFEDGQGGALTPVMCVDKHPSELDDFKTLADESRRTGQPWNMVLVAALAGPGGQAPTSADVDRALRSMVASVHRGAIERFLAFDQNGLVMRFG
jgi:hypothetical protein